MPHLSNLLFSEYRRRVLGLLILHPEKPYHVREIARLTSTIAGSLHRELSKLAKAEILTRTLNGHQVYYQANRSCPIFEELASIFRKTSGIVDVLANALTSVANKIQVALVFGSVGSGKESMASDVDLLIIGDISFTEAVSALYSAQNTIGREINPKVYRMAEWIKLVDNHNAFVEEILQKPKLFIIGTTNDIK